jgi:hypothetical protein
VGLFVILDAVMLFVRVSAVILASILVTKNVVVVAAVIVKAASSNAKRIAVPAVRMIVKLSVIKIVNWIATLIV